MRRHFIFMLIIAFFLMLASTIPLSANGHSVNLYLSYLPDVSTWGPTDAVGQATVNVGEGYISLEAGGLPLVEGQAYEVWLVSPRLENWVSLGKFNVTSEGAAAFENAVELVPVEDYRYLVITLEPAGDIDTLPSEQISIGGIFPNPDVAVTLAVPAGVERPSEAGSNDAAAIASEDATPVPPEYLPETGAASGVYWLWVGLALTGLAGGIGIMSFRLLRRQN